MERVRAAMGLPPDGYRTDPRLIEVHFGDWQGFTFAELEARTARLDGGAPLDKWNFVPPGAARRELRDAARRASRRGSSELRRPTVCVTHGGVIRVLFRLVGRHARRAKPRPWTSPRTAC